MTPHVFAAIEANVNLLRADRECNLDLAVFAEVLIPRDSEAVVSWLATDRMPLTRAAHRYTPAWNASGSRPEGELGQGRFSHVPNEPPAHQRRKEMQQTDQKDCPRFVCALLVGHPRPANAVQRDIVEVRTWRQERNGLESTIDLGTG